LVTQSGKLGTAGYAAHGVLAQSIGGGGGVSGGGSTLGKGLITIGATGYSSDGGGGDGGSVTITGSGTITTGGADAYGILAQSIGSGGGIASLDSAVASVTLGLTDESNTISGQGGNVSVKQNSGSITTSGARAFGILAQSIGGSGGVAAMSAANLSQATLTGAFGMSGAVTIDVGTAGANPAATTITTSGAGAFGILAQSISDGGGLVGDTSLMLATPQSNTLYLETVNELYGGNVDISLTAEIETTGANAHGIFAQSLMSSGGLIGQGVCLVAGNVPGTLSAGYSGTVTIDQTGGSIAATGEGSIGIFAQSSGNTANTGAIAINVAGSVEGGTQKPSAS
jgi:hypothetical protein